MGRYAPSWGGNEYINTFGISNMGFGSWYPSTINEKRYQNTQGHWLVLDAFDADSFN